MIVPSMNMDEIINEIENQIPYIINILKNTVPKLRRQAIKNKTNIVHFFKVTDKKHNNWIIYLNVNKKRFKCAPFIYYINNLGFNTIKVGIGYLNQNPKINPDKILIHYPSHFFERYNERFLNIPNLSKIEILKIYIENNPEDSFKYLQTIQDGLEETFDVINDGVGLGYSEIINNIEIFHNKTFINTDMLLGNQYDHRKLTLEYRDHMNSIIHPKPIVNKKSTLI